MTRNNMHTYFKQISIKITIGRRYPGYIELPYTVELP